MNNQIENIRRELSTFRNQIFSHPLYSKINNIQCLRTFMEHHVFAVWDFMSLLKTLQNRLTCTDIPWIPVGSAETRYLINEIVCGEESDIDEHGNRTSHFELYIRAMKQINANTNLISKIISDARDKDFNLNKYEIPHGARKFLDFTFEVIKSEKTHVIASVFTFGREDLIPEMFNQMVADLNSSEGGNLSVFKYYLDRHIEIDGGHHRSLSHKMISELCGQDEEKWQESLHFAKVSLQNRKMLWDSALDSINNES